MCYAYISLYIYIYIYIYTYISLKIFSCNEIKLRIILEEVPMCGKTINLYFYLLLGM